MRPASDQAVPIEGMRTSTSRRSSPRCDVSHAPWSSTRAMTSGATTAPPKEGRTATRMPRRTSRCVPRPASQPSTFGRLRGSRLSWPLLTSSHLAVSRTDRLMQPGTAVSDRTSWWGPFGMRP